MLVQVRAPAKQAVLDAREAACAAEEVQGLAKTLAARRPRSTPVKPSITRVRSSASVTLTTPVTSLPDLQTERLL